MMKVASIALTVVLSLALASGLLAADKKKGRGAKSPEVPTGLALVGLAQKLDLTAEQTAKLEALREEYRPKLREGYQKIQGIVTEEQRKARQEAVKSAQAAGKSEEEARAAGETAMKLTDEQKAKMDEVRKGMAPIEKELREKVLALLTPEQKAQVDKAARPKKASAK